MLLGVNDLIRIQDSSQKAESLYEEFENITLLLYAFSRRLSCWVVFVTEKLDTVCF